MLLIDGEGVGGGELVLGSLEDGVLEAADELDPLHELLLRVLDLGHVRGQLLPRRWPLPGPYSFGVALRWTRAEEDGEEKAEGEEELRHWKEREKGEDAEEGINVRCGGRELRMWQDNLNCLMTLYRSLVIFLIWNVTDLFGSTSSSSRLVHKKYFPVPSPLDSRHFPIFIMFLLNQILEYPPIIFMELAEPYLQLELI